MVEAIVEEEEVLEVVGRFSPQPAPHRNFLTKNPKYLGPLKFFGNRLRR
jgi:hypothetical protein